jgi:hypothetical protein
MKSHEQRKTKRVGIAVLTAFSGLLLLLAGATAGAQEATGIVLDAKGEPVAGARIVLEVGRARFALSDDFDRWLSVSRKQGETDETGRFTFEGLPPGTVDKNGTFQVDRVPPGEAKVYVNRNNWTAAEAGVKVEPGRTAVVKGLRVTDGYFAEADPLIDARKALLVDERKRPLSGVRLAWSSPWMAGSIPSDDKGIVLLVGGGVAIGLPPFRLRLCSLEGEDVRYWGELKRVSRGCAHVLLHRLVRVTGTVKRGEEVLKDFVLLGTSAQDPPRIYTGREEEGLYSIHLPAGKAVLAFGTADGAVHRHEIEIDPSKDAYILDFDLGGK